MEKAIKCAVEGGYEIKSIEGWILTFEDIDIENSREILLDPLFWQALGKQQGWVSCCSCGQYICIHENKPWKYKWLRFIDHIADGGAIDTFFYQLLKP